MYLDNDYNPYSTSDNGDFLGTQQDMQQTNPPEFNKPDRPQKPKKNNSKVKKRAGFVAGAVLLGAIAGGTCFGVNYAGNKLFPAKESTTQSAEKNTSQVQKPAQSLISNPDIKKEITATVMDVSDIVEQVISSVVAIEATVTGTQNYGMFGPQQYTSKVRGSGFIIKETDEEILLVTNNHVIEGGEDIRVNFYDGNSAPATVKASKSNPDVAVIAINKSDIPVGTIYTIAKFAETTPEIGEAAIAIGNSLGEGISVTSGIVGALNRTITVDGADYENLILTDAAINSGNSGGPLFNAMGEVIGINSVKTKSTGVEGMCYAISIDSVEELIGKLSTEDTRTKYSDEERGYLGIVGTTISSEISKQYGYPVGVLVRSVVEDSAAEDAGIIKNDIIISFDGEKIYSFEELRESMCYYAIGQEVEIVYCHMNETGDYEEKTVKVVLKANNN